MPPPPRRVPPAAPPPALAWLETEPAGSLPEQHRLLLVPPSSPALPNAHRKLSQAGFTLAVFTAPKKYTKCPVAAEATKPSVKTKFQKRKDKIISVLKPPYFILTMIIIMVLVHVLDAGRERERAEARGGGARAALEWAGGAAWWRQPWRALSYSLVHASASHLALNALVALAVGWRLEAEQGSWRVAVLWWAGAAAGALAAGALQPKDTVVGASAAVYTLLTAHIANVCLRFGHIPLWWFRPLSVVVLGSSEACWAATQRGDVFGHVVRVAWSAHALGAALGLPLAFLVFTGENSERRCMRVSRWASGAALAAAAALCALHYAGALPAPPAAADLAPHHHPNVPTRAPPSIWIFSKKL